MPVGDVSQELKIKSLMGTVMMRNIKIKVCGRHVLGVCSKTSRISRMVVCGNPHVNFNNFETKSRNDFKLELDLGVKG